MPGTAGHALVALLTAVLCACSHSRTLDRQPAMQPGATVPLQSRFVDVIGPTVVGFFPAYPEGAIQTDPGLASGLEHFQFAMADTARCAELAGVKVLVVVADSVLIRNGKQEETLQLKEIVPENAGCYLVAPGKGPRIVRGGAGTSSLVQRCPAAAAVYFDIASCCPPGIRCCPDGRVVGDTLSCDG